MNKLKKEIAITFIAVAVVGLIYSVLVNISNNMSSLFTYQTFVFVLVYVLLYFFYIWISQRQTITKIIIVLLLIIFIVLMLTLVDMNISDAFSGNSLSLIKFIYSSMTNAIIIIVADKQGKKLEILKKKKYLKNLKKSNYIEH